MYQGPITLILAPAHYLDRLLRAIRRRRQR